MERADVYPITRECSYEIPSQTMISEQVLGR